MAKYERFSMPPRALSPQYKALNANRRITAFDHQRLAMERLKMEESARIKNEMELHADLFDFNNVMETDEYGFPLHTPYKVSETVPQVYVPPVVETNENQNSVKPADSPANPPAGTE